jgi:hypothetical protein
VTRYARWTAIGLLVLLGTSTALFAKGGKSVHVRGYTRKDGTYVAPHYRSSPGSRASATPKTTYRSEPRTKYRDWFPSVKVVVVDDGDEDKKKKLRSSPRASSVRRDRTPTGASEPSASTSPAPRELKTPNYIVYWSNGKTALCVDYEDLKTAYIVHWPQGHSGRFYKDQILRFEPIFGTQIDE